MNTQEDSKPNFTSHRIEAFRVFFTHILDSDIMSVLNHFVYFILYSLALPSLSSFCTSQAVSLFDVLAKNLSSRSVLIHASSIQSLILNHRDTHLSVLFLPQHMRYRPIFYGALTQIMLHGAVPGDLEQFVKPFINELQDMKQKQQFEAMVPLLRDITGIFRSCTEEKNYVCVYDLLYASIDCFFVDVRFALSSSSSKWSKNGQIRSSPQLFSAFWQKFR